MIKEMLTRSWQGRIKLFEEEVSYKFSDKILLRHSLSHPSYDPKSRFELLEFIGDRAIGIVASLFLWNLNPASEKQYAQWYTSLSNREALDKLVQYMNLAKYVQWKGDTAHGKTILRDACEAVIGAIMIDGGQLALSNVLVPYLARLHTNPTSPDPKGILQNWAAKKLLPYSYKLISETGPPHDKEYVVKLEVRNYKEVFGSGKSIRDAEKATASEFIRSNINEE